MTSNNDEKQKLTKVMYPTKTETVMFGLACLLVGLAIFWAIDLLMYQELQDSSKVLAIGFAVGAAFGHRCGFKLARTQE